MSIGAPKIKALIKSRGWVVKDLQYTQPHGPAEFTSGGYLIRIQTAGYEDAPGVDYRKLLKGLDEIGATYAYQALDLISRYLPERPKTV